MALVGPGLEDFRDLGDREHELAFRVVVMRPEPQSRIGPEVAEDLALVELLVHGLELGRAHRHGAAAARRIARAADLEAGLVEQVDQELRLPDRVLTYAIDADLLDQVVAGSRRIERGHVRCAGEEAADPVRVFELRLEAERARMSLPADEGRLEDAGEVRPDVKPACARP